jgi:rod shape-determining protein MreC
MFATRASRRRGLAYVVLIAVSLVMLAVSGTPPVQQLRAGVSFALAPIQSGLAGFTRGAASIVSTIGEIDTLRRDDRDLQAANQALAAENRRLQSLVSVNQTLTALLQVRSTLDYRTVAAEVIGRQVTQSERVVSLSVGSDRGVSVGDVVLAGGAALVGRVIEVGPNYSRVLLISDTRSTVIGLVEPTRTTGDLQGQLGGSLVMSQIPSTDEVNVDDEVVTAGIDLGNGIRSPFPKGLLVGRVVDVERDPTAVVQTAFVEAAAPLDRLEYVLVITDYEGGIPIAPSPSPSPQPSAGGSPEATASNAPGGSAIDLPSPSLQLAP